jgi:NADPH2:quinone reductase
VIATARGPGLKAARDAGADVALDYGAPDLAAQILAANGGAPVDQIVEVEFGANLATDTAVIAENGRIVAYGSAREMTPALPFYPLMFKAVTLEMALVYALTPAQRTQAVAHLDAALAAGALRSRVAQVFALEECAAAHDTVAAGDRAGAILLEI